MCWVVFLKSWMPDAGNWGSYEETWAAMIPSISLPPKRVKFPSSKRSLIPSTRHLSPLYLSVLLLFCFNFLLLVQCLRIRFMIRYLYQFSWLLVQVVVFNGLVADLLGLGFSISLVKDSIWIYWIMTFSVFVKEFFML